MKTINQSVLFRNVGPDDLYDAILNPKMHSIFTGAKATGTMKVGGKFTAFDGFISGTNTELVKNKKIVQQWTCTDFPEGHITKATFEFEKTKTGSKLTFTQTNVPEKNYADISNGWHEYYWNPIKKLLEK